MEDVLGEIEKTEKELEDAFTSQRQQARRLGIAFSSSDNTSLVISPTMKENVIRCENEYDELKARLEACTAAISALEGDKRNLKRLEAERRQLESTLSDARIRLGAIAFEQAQCADAPAELAAALSSYTTTYRSLSERAAGGGLSGFAASIRFRSVVRGQKKDFNAICTILEREGLLHMLGGERAPALVHEVEKTSVELKSIIAEIEECRAHADKVQGEGSERPQQLADAVKEAGRVAEEAEISYGMYLFQNGAKWIASDTPALLLDIVSAMLSEQKKIDALQQKSRRAQDKLAIDDFRLMIKNNCQKQEALRSEIAMIQRQIEDISAENEVLEKKIRGLIDGRDS